MPIQRSGPTPSVTLDASLETFVDDASGFQRVVNAGRLGHRPV
jgi:hypothetical protein